MSGRNEHNRDWRQQNPEQAAKMRERWLKQNPSYYANYIQERGAVTDALIFQFLDNGFGDGTLEEFIVFLQAEKVPEKHIGWFRVGVKKELEKREKEKEGFGRRLHGFTQKGREKG